MNRRLAPIALFAYNRPRHLARTVEALRRDPLAPASDLHVFCDGAKTEAAAAAVGEVRAFVRSIDGFNSVTVTERDRNLGLANSIIDGVGALCNRFGRVIVLEDDLIVAPGFLRFMNDALERYADDERVTQIAGYMFPIAPEFAARAIFLPFPTSWGWATWQRAWRYFDPAMTSYAALTRSPKLRRQFDLDGAYPYFTMLERQIRGEVDSWAIRWHLSCFMRQGLTLAPGTTLVRNIGFDGSGTHGTCEDLGLAESLPSVGHDFAFPRKIAVDAEAYSEVKRALPARMNSPGGFAAALKRLWR